MNRCSWHRTSPVCLPRRGSSNENSAFDALRKLSMWIADWMRSTIWLSLCTATFRTGTLTLGCVLLLGCAAQPQVQIPDATDERTGNHTLYVVSHGWHTGLILPLQCIASRLPSLVEGFAVRETSGHEINEVESSWVEIGWGDKGFYQAQEITVGLALQAFFASPGAVLHVVQPEESARTDGMPPNPNDYFTGSEVVALRISEQELDSVCRFVALSFERNPDGGLLPLGTGLYGDSRFYEAKGRYHALHTCNTWTAKGLASAGIVIEPQGTLTARGVMRAARQSVRAGQRP